jgi:NADH:ubiquinone oxidoreductase subunit K
VRFFVYFLFNFFGAFAAQGGAKDTFLETILFPNHIIFFTYSVMFAALVLIFFLRQHSNLLLLLLYIELSLFLTGFLFALLFLISFSYFTGLIYAITILALTAAEAVVGLSLLLAYFKANSGTISAKAFSGRRPSMTSVR